jgi:hypothetical protein
MKLGKHDVESSEVMHVSLVLLVLIVIAYLFGAFSYSRSLWPIELLRQIKDGGEAYATSMFNLNHFDSLGRLTFDPYKKQVKCPVQAEDTGVLLIIGQSNAANYGEKKFTTQYPRNVVNYFNGRCYVASSPLLGAGGQRGEFYTPLADRLISKGTYRNIVIIAAGVGGSSIARWQRGGDLNEDLIALIKEVQAKFRITEVIWHQGESELLLRTTAKVYVASFQSLLGTLTEFKVSAPTFVSIATRSCNAANWTEANPVAIGQRLLIDNRRIFLGADTDKLVELRERDDRCHFSETGQLKTAEAFADSIAAVKNQVWAND